MHIVEGVLSAPVLITGAVGTVIGTAWGLKRLNEENLAITGVLSATFFVASLVKVPVLVSSVHLMLGGLLAMVLGPLTFPAVLIAVVLQTVFFGFGGVLVLGVNVLNVALPSIVVASLLRPYIRAGAHWAAGALGALSVLGTSAMVALSLSLSGQEFWLAAQATVIAHLPLAAVEGVLVAAALSLLTRVRPELLQ